MVEYLGLVLSEGCMEMDPIKIAGVWDWPTPKNITEVQSFVGFINFYCRFIPNFSHVAGPLHHLTKEELWRWTEPEETAFQELKPLVTSAPVLILPNQDMHFQLETDASGYTMGAILSQLCDNEKWHPVSFTSKSLNPAECNYAIYNKELLSVICGLEEWRHILEGTKHRIEILNDHRNLMYFRMAQTLNCCQAQWFLYLSQFNYSLTHRASKLLAKPNALSRCVNHQVKGEDNEDQVMLPAECFTSEPPDPPAKCLLALWVRE